jgi:hypothetical protein
MKATPGVAADAWGTFADQLARRSIDAPDLQVSIVAPNTMGLEWWPNGWTHVWEQAFDDDPGMRRALVGEAELLDNGPIEGWIDVYYRFEP